MAEAPEPIDIADLAFKAGVSVEDLDQECRECDLSDLAHLCDPWELIGHYLRLKEADVSAIKENYSIAEIRRLIMLKKWRDTNLRPTYRVLIEALLRCGKTWQALAICKKVRDLNYVRSREQYNVNDSPVSLLVQIPLSSLRDTAEKQNKLRPIESLRELDQILSDVYRQFAIAGVTLEELILCISTSFSCTPSLYSRLCRSASAPDFLTDLKQHCGIFSHGILDDLIESLGDNESKRKMSEFKKKMKAFEQRTKIKDLVSNYEGSMTTSPECKVLEMKLGENWQEKTLDSEDFHKSLVCQRIILNTSIYSLNEVNDSEIISKVMKEENIETIDIPDDLHVDPSNVQQVKSRDCKRYYMCTAFAKFDSHEDPRPIRERDGHTNTWTSAYAWCTIDLKQQCIAHRWSQRCGICGGESYPWYDEMALERMTEYAVKRYLTKAGIQSIEPPDYCTLM